MVELGGMAERLPKQLSGGQQQRVALARAIVFKPRLLLLDEPFGALDRKLRETMQLEVRRLQRRLGLTTLFITHDQEEALVMSDRIAVMDKGALAAGRPPHEIYEAPANAFVADFVGECNIFHGIVEAGAATWCGSGSSAALHRVAGRRDCRRGRVSGFADGRPERFVDLAAGGAPVPVNRIDGAVTESAYIGVSVKYRIASAEGLEMLVRLPTRAGSRRYRAGEPIAAGLPCRRRAPDRGAVTPMAVSSDSFRAAGCRSPRRAQVDLRFALGPFALTLPALLLLTLLFVLPLGRLFALSFEGGSFDWYAKALTGGLYTDGPGTGPSRSRPSSPLLPAARLSAWVS